jgi:prevent-host-death family protein
MQVNVLEAKNRLSQLIKAAEAGEEVVIANRGEPVVRLVPATQAGTTGPAGNPQRILAWKERNQLPAHLRRSAEEIDAEVEAERKASHGLARNILAR